MPHILTAQKVAGRLIYSGAVTTATDGTSDISSNVISVPVGKLVTLVWAVSAVSGGGYWHKAYLQGSVDGTNFSTLKTIEVDASGSATKDLTAPGTVAKTHDPSTAGDFPYYRITTDAENDTAGHVGKLWLLVN
jgi:hypothetical protein